MTVLKKSFANNMEKSSKSKVCKSVNTTVPSDSNKMVKSKKLNDNIPIYDSSDDSDSSAPQDAFGMSKEMSALELKSTSPHHQYKISPVIQGNALKAFVIKPLSNLSSNTKQFLDILDLANDSQPCGGYSFLQDRIGSLLRFATRKTWNSKGSSSAPQVSNKAVKSMVSTVESKNKKPDTPDLLSRGKKFVPNKSTTYSTNQDKRQTKRQKETKKASSSASAKRPLTNKFKLKLNFNIPGKKNKLKQSVPIAESKTPVKDCGVKNENDIAISTIHNEINIDSMNDNQDNLDEDASDHDLLEETIISEDYGLSEEGESMLANFSDPVYDADGNEFMIESCIEVDEYENIVDVVQEATSNAKTDSSETTLTVSSINDVLADQCKDESADTDTGMQYYLEEECKTLTPYSNEAILYRMLFPGKKLPICNEDIETLPDYLNEVTIVLDRNNLGAQFCKEIIVGDEQVKERACSNEILVLICPFKEPIPSEDICHEYKRRKPKSRKCNITTIEEYMHDFHLCITVCEPSIYSCPLKEKSPPPSPKEPIPPIKEPIPLPKEPTPPPKDPTPPPKDPTPPPKDPTPPPKDPTPPPKDPTPPPKDPTPPPKDPTPPPKEPSPSPKEPTPPVKEPTPSRPPPKPKRKPLKKKKKVYDRNFLRAVQMNKVNEVHRLLWDGADPDTSCSIGTVLHQATQVGSSTIVQELLWGGAETEMKNELGDTPLHLAAIGGHNDIATLLTSFECDVDAQNNYNITPLHMALTYGNLEVVRTLVRIYADLDIPDKIGVTAKDLVSQLGYPKEILDPFTSDSSCFSKVPAKLDLLHAVEKGSAKEVRRALSENACPNTIVPLALHWPGHSTVLHRVAHLGFADIVRDLLSAGSNPNSKDMVGNTPLHTAVQGSAQEDVVRLLVDSGADVNAATQSGVTALHRAAAKGRESTMLLLLKFGADVNLKDNQDKTPIEWAKQKGYMMLARSISRYL